MLYKEIMRNRYIKYILMIFLLGALLGVALYFGFKNKAADKSNDSKDNTSITKEEKKMKDLKITTTIFPIYDFVRVVRGNEDNLTILNNETEISLEKIESSDIIIYMDDEGYDYWMKVALDSLGYGDSNKLIELSNQLGDTRKYSWNSIENAIKMVNYIAIILSEKDPDFTETYIKNAQAYINKLDELRTKFYTVISEGATTTIYVKDEEEKEKIQCLMDELKIELLVDPEKATEFKSLHEISSTQETSYLKIMESNVEVLKDALRFK